MSKNNSLGASANADQALVASDQANLRCLDPLGFDPSRGGFWTEDYIDDAASVRCKIYRRDGSLFCDNSSNYDPPSDGIHLCGVTDDGEQPTTVAVYCMTPEAATYAWQLAREVAECERDEGDFIVDLCIDDSIEDDFWSNRQLWSLAIRAWNAALASAMSAGTDATTQIGAGLQPASAVPAGQTPEHSSSHHPRDPDNG